MRGLWALLLFVSIASAQTAADSVWVRSFGGRDEDQAAIVRETGDGGYLFAGTASDVLTGAALLVRTDSTGRVLWRRQITEPAACIARDVQVLSNGILLAGSAGGPAGSEYPCLLRLNVFGETEWTRLYTDGAHGGIRALRPLVDGAGFVLAGWTTAPATGQMDIALSRTDTAGNLLWTRTYGGAGDEWAADVCLVNNGFVIAAQAIRGSREPDAICWLRIDSTGKLTDSRRFSVENLGRVRNLTPIPGGGFLISWTPHEFYWWTPVLAGLLRLDAGGNELWRQHYAGGQEDESSLQLRLPEYGILLAAYRISMGSGTRTMTLLHTDPDGGQQSQLIYEGLGYADWKKIHWNWTYVYAYPFAAGLSDFFHAAYLPPTTRVAVYPPAPFPERSRRHAPYDSFSNVFQVRFSLAARERVSITLHDSAGQMVDRIAEGEYPAGAHVETVDGWQQPAGIYFVCVDTGELQTLTKVAFVR
jgi:hypothetical protein